MSKLDYRVGSIISYRSGGEIRRIRVERKEADIKNGEPGFTGVQLDRHGKPMKGILADEPVRRVWGYDEQILF
jgi:hypothetical protein